MPARVFISCGQATNEERATATELEQWFRSKGYDPYVAIQAQTIRDLNAGIIGALAASDYYVFVNFCREKCIFAKDELYRGSLYSHQELAIAYAFGFDHILVINHKKITHEGVEKFLVTNIPAFENGSEVLPRITEAVQKAGWSPKYSRHLFLTSVRWAPEIIFGDPATREVRFQKTLHADLRNNRSDCAAYHVIAHLNEIIDLKANRPVDHNDRTLLKASGFLGYEHTIWPDSHCSFDLLAISVKNPQQIFLNSSLDLSPRTPIINSPGRYELRYRFIAEKYPLLERGIQLEHTGDIATIKADLI